VSPDLARYLDWLRAHGVRFDVARDLVHEEDHDGPLVPGDEAMRPVELPGIPPFVEHRDPEGGLAADHATFSLAAALLPRLPLGARFWDVGCGTGVLVVAAGLGGASMLVATDVDERAIALARRTAADANVNVRFCRGALLAAVPEKLGADVVAANLPHKPCPPGGALPLSQSGGPDGAEHHAGFATQAARRLASGAVVYFWLHSLPHPRLLLAYQDFDLTLLSWKRRLLEPGEHTDLLPHWRRTGHVADQGGRAFLVGGAWAARRR
jgi:SAM-dependent methyltransferase